MAKEKTDIAVVDIDLENPPTKPLECLTIDEQKALREKIRFCFEHGVLPARYVDDKVNNKISEQKLDEAMACISYGESLGIGAKLALDCTMIVNGKMTVWGDALGAITYKSGLMDYKEESFDYATNTAICTIKRKDMSKPETRTFSFEQAQMAGLFGKGVWAKYPHRMAAQRAKTYAFRDIFPDVLQGVITTEEAQEIGNQHITDYSNVIAQPTVKKVEKVVEDVVAISYTPLEDIQLELQKITDISKLGMYFKEVKPKVNVAETQKLVEMFKMRKAELSQPIETVQENV